MSEQSRNKILNRLQNTKAREEIQTSSSGFHFLREYNQPLIQTFEEKLANVNGTFILAENKEDFKWKFQQFVNEKRISSVFCCENNIADLLKIELVSELNENIEASVTGCEYLVAQTGSAIVSTAQTHSRRTFAYAPIHIIVAFKNQLVAQLEEGLNLLAEKYKNNLPSQITTITGPSRTADIEKTLVLGAHGPKELIIFYIDE